MASGLWPVARVRVLTYNIRHGGTGRESAIASVINAANVDLVVFQEATKPAVIEKIEYCTR